MPKAIILLLVIAGIGMVGSLALMILTVILNKKSSANAAAEAEEEIYQDELSEQYEEMEGEPAEQENAEDVVFTPLEKEVVEEQQDYAEEEKTIQPQAAEEPQQEEPETVQAGNVLQLVDIAEIPMRNSAVVGGISLSVGNAQDIGMRMQQQDAFAITPLEEQDVVARCGVMAVVCDGMGGMENGAEAANLGVVTFMRQYLEADEVNEYTMVDAVFAANDAVYRENQGKNGAIAGTTLVAASIREDGVRFVSVGDSHIYLYRNGKVYQLNRDHNYFSILLEEVKAGTITLEEAQHHPERAHLTSYVGIETLELVDYNVEPVELRHGDRILLCSDGLFKTLSIAEIAKIMENSTDYDAQDALLQAVKNKGKRKQDNTTVVVLYCDEA